MDQARETHSGFLEFLPTSTNSGVSSSTIDLTTLSALQTLRTKFNLYALALQVKDLDAAGSGSAQPVSVGAEHQGVDGIAGLERVQVLAIVQVPEHGNTILATRGGEGSIGGDRDGVDVAGVAVVVCAEFALGELPNLCKQKGKRVRHAYRDQGGGEGKEDQRSW